jgi:tetratricopeptide (TPR) repeat protein
MATWASVASSMADSLFRAGRLHESLELAERALGEEARDTAELQSTVGMSPFLLMRLDRSSALAYTGQLERAVAELDDARRRVEAGHRELTIWCLSTYSALAELSGDPRGGLPEAQEACQLAERAGSSLGVHYAHLALGRGLLACGRGPEAVEVLERTVVLSREHRVALVDEGAALAYLGEAFGATGSWLRARGAITDGLEVARERGTRLWQCRLELALARMLLAERGTRAADEIEKTIGCGLASAKETGARSFEPPLFEVRAALASLRGDASAERADLAAARGGYLACGAHWHAARLAGAP